MYPFPILLSFQRSVGGCYLTFGIAFQLPDRTEHTWETSTAARGLESRSAIPFRTSSQALLGKGNMQNLQENPSLARKVSLGVTLSPYKGKICVEQQHTQRGALLHPWVPTAPIFHVSPGCTAKRELCKHRPNLPPNFRHNLLTRWAFLINNGSCEKVPLQCIHVPQSAQQCQQPSLI